MSKLWKKSSGKLNSLIETYTVGEDYLLDKTLMPYDIQGTKAHAKGLTKIGILSKAELAKILKRLTQLEKEFNAGKVKIKIQDEDCHTVIENYLTGKYKSIGKKIHTGRSRNDQVLTALRLYMQDQLSNLQKESKKLAKNFLTVAEKYQKIPLPGYSHTQQAMLSSVGHHFLSFTESLIDDLELLGIIKTHLSKNPLGSAAGYGVPLLLPRELTTKELKLKQTQINSLYCISSRGKFESLYLEGLIQIMLTLGRFASDIILFTSQEFNFFEVKDSLVTGSSIMPQKRNLDGLEILRGNVNILISHQLLIKNIVNGLTSGYHRDMQLIKKPLMESTQLVLNSLQIADLYLKGLSPNQKTIEAKITKGIFMADLATEIAKKKKVPFRTAYKQAFKQLGGTKSQPITPEYIQQNIEEKVSLGAAGNLDLHHYKMKLKKL